MRKLKMTPGMFIGIGVLICAILLAACSTDGGDPYEDGYHDPYEGKLLILQTYGTGSDSGGAVSHNFVELYNKSQETLNLSGITLQYADGTEAGEAPVDPNWKAISLSGSIPAGRSFLILGKKDNTNGRLQLADDSGDVKDDNFVMNNHAYKVALIRTTGAVSAANPFSPRVSGYIDMIGATNDAEAGDSINAYETAPQDGISKQKSARRKNLNDTNNNAKDFENVDYRASGTTNAQAAAWKPKNLEDGEWNPMAEVVEPPPPEGSEKLMILQAYGNGQKTDSAITHSFVELYNNTNSAINLDSYSLQIANAADGDEWTVIDLTGSIPAHGSYLIRGGAVTDPENSRLDLSSVTPDVDDSFVLDNKEFKIALMSNTTALNVANPFGTDGEETVVAGYVDMLGTGTTAKVTGYETGPIDGISKQKSARRKSLADTDNNAEDFKIHEYKADGLSDDDLEKCRPRTANEGDWTPEFP